MNKKDLLRGIPKVDEVLSREPLFVLSERYGAAVVKDAARNVIEEMRAAILRLEDEIDEDLANKLTRGMSVDTVAANIAAKMSVSEEHNLRPVINATGTILHTNLGRSPLCKDATDNVQKISLGYSSLEYNVAEGKRGSRHDIVGDLIVELTGAEDAMVVNNNAAATMIVLAAMGAGKEIIVSRGELVEIGGAFRIPDIMEQSGAFLQEIGCTNKTKISDYEKNIITADEAEDLNDIETARGVIRYETAALMKVHKSNYDIEGFTEEATLEELVALGKKNRLPVIYDMGNGLMVDMSEYGLDEPNVPASLKTGVDVILFSGDKLLGGPQAGIIAGKKKYIEAMKKHPLARAMRVDKMTFAALEATLKKYRDEKVALRDIPILNMISAGENDMKAKAEKLAATLQEACPDLVVDVVRVEDQIGGGSAPMVRLPGYAVAVAQKSSSAQTIERKLRKAATPIVARIQNDQLLLCVRTIFEDEFTAIAKVFK